MNRKAEEAQRHRGGLKTYAAAICLSLLATPSINSFAQRKQPTLVCKQAAFASLKELPALEYECDPNQTSDSDEKILKLPARLKAIRLLEQTLAAFNDAAWWRAEVDDLNVCDCRGKPGNFTEEEKDKFLHGDYMFRLFGTHQIRLVLLSDPCYQTGFGGANAFLLYRKAGKVFVTQVLDGYYSRADNSVGIALANLNGEQIVEIASTSGGLNPYVTNYYFAINPKTNRAVPKTIFRDGKKLTNEIRSALLLTELKDLGLPPSAAELNIVRGHRMAPSFSVYKDAESGKIDDNSRKLVREIYRWNGRFYILTRK